AQGASDASTVWQYYRGGGHDRPGTNRPGLWHAGSGQFLSKRFRRFPGNLLRCAIDDNCVCDAFDWRFHWPGRVVLGTDVSPRTPPSGATAPRTGDASGGRHPGAGVNRTGSWLPNPAPLGREVRDKVSAVGHASPSPQRGEGPQKRIVT